MNHQLTTIIVAVLIGVVANLLTALLRRLPGAWLNFRNFRQEFLELRLYAIEEYSENPARWLARLSTQIVKMLFWIGLYIFLSFPFSSSIAVHSRTLLIARSWTFGSFLGTGLVACWQVNEVANPRLKKRLQKRLRRMKEDPGTDESESPKSA